MVSIKLKNVTKAFEDFKAVDNVSFEIKDKEFFVLLGPSGSGKSTTLNMLAGFEPPTDGVIEFDGNNMNEVVPENRDVAMVFQSYALYPTMSAYDNIAFPLRIKKVPKDQVDDDVKRIADMLGIGHLLEKKPHALSGGERQRVALSRAIVRKPNVFLMDEPLSNLDAKLRVHMRSELIRLQKKLNITTIYVTHDQTEAMSMADRVAVMDQGEIVQLSSPADIYDKPANTFVAGFVGSPPMNFFDVSRSNGSLDVAGFKIKLPKTILDKLSKSAKSELVAGIRPGDLKVTDKKDGAISAKVLTVEVLGSETLISVDINGIEAKVLAERRAKISGTINLVADPTLIHVFDKSSKALLSG